MNLAEKIYEDNYIEGYCSCLEAMREIAWEAWKMGALSHSDPSERIEITKHAFNEWYDKQLDI